MFIEVAKDMKLYEPKMGQKWKLQQEARFRKSLKFPIGREGSIHSIERGCLHHFKNLESPSAKLVLLWSLQSCSDGAQAGLEQEWDQGVLLNSVKISPGMCCRAKGGAGCIVDGDQSAGYLTLVLWKTKESSQAPDYKIGAALLTASGGKNKQWFAPVD